VVDEQGDPVNAHAIPSVKVEIAMPYEEHTMTVTAITEIRANVPSDASRATAAAIWCDIAAEAGYAAEVVGKNDASDPIVQIDRGDRYVL
jgi:hypothetical protein